MPDSNDLLIVLDCGWIPAASYKNPAEICIKKVQEIKEALGEKNIQLQYALQHFLIILAK